MQDSSKAPHSFSIILFDLGNVLVRVDYPAFLRTLGFDHKMSERELYKLLEVESRAYEMGKVTPEEYFRCVKKKLGIAYTFDQFQRAWSSILPEPVLGMSELVQSLASRYRLMILSNTNKLHFEHMRELLPVFQYIERFFLSYEIGALKPDRAIYDYVLKHVDIPARQLLFIDDLEPNIVAARKVGITGILFQDPGHLKHELKRLNVI